MAGLGDTSEPPCRQAPTPTLKGQSRRPVLGSEVNTTNNLWRYCPYTWVHKRLATCHEAHSSQKTRGGQSLLAPTVETTSEDRQSGAVQVSYRESDPRTLPLGTPTTDHQRCLSCWSSACWMGWSTPSLRLTLKGSLDQWGELKTQREKVCILTPTNQGRWWAPVRTLNPVLALKQLLWDLGSKPTMQPAHQFQPKEEQVETPGQLPSRGGYTGDLSADKTPLSGSRGETHGDTETLTVGAGTLGDHPAWVHSQSMHLSGGALPGQCSLGSQPGSEPDIAGAASSPSAPGS